jgi:hypothetical protein
MVVGVSSQATMAAEATRVNTATMERVMAAVRANLTPVDQLRSGGCGQRNPRARTWSLAKPGEVRHQAQAGALAGESRLRELQFGAGGDQSAGLNCG